MIIKTIVVGMLETNCYIVGDDSSKDVFIIDPGADFKKIKNIIDTDGLKPKAIINTHGHGDHIGANARFDLPLWIHRLDAGFLEDPSKNLSITFGRQMITKTADRFLEDGDILKIGRYSLKVIQNKLLI